ncbi:hypothetical protein [Saccharopolyspora spinosa]|nr:hypothetical protein [Saccharopolyspora spinosa]
MAVQIWGEEGLFTGEVDIEVEHDGPALRVRLAQPLSFCHRKGAMH